MLVPPSFYKVATVWKGTGWFCYWFSFNTQPSLPYPIHNKSNPPDGAFVVDEKLV
nr:hypothetical protein [uncultured Trichococcus sp.]